SRFFRSCVHRRILLKFSSVFLFLLQCRWRRGLRGAFTNCKFAMLLACDCDDDAQTADTINGDAPMLSSYRAPPLADHLLDKPHWLSQLKPWRRHAHGDDHLSAGIAINWSSVRSATKDWITNPMNIAMLLWLLCVAVSGAMLVLLLLGLLDGAFPTPAARNHWIEINNQVLNALFTLMSLYQHPVLCHHLFLLCRRRAALRVRAALRRLLEDPDERTVRASGERGVLRLAVGDGLRPVALLLAVRAGAGGAHGEPLPHRWRDVLQEASCC
ncbi:Os12g0109700, partial [Oryza sativa Japonica Group]